MTDVLLTGATGHVGGRLLRSFEADGVAVRCLARSPEKLLGVTATTEVVAGDVGDRDAAAAAMSGARTAYYLVHSLDADGDFERQELAQAEAFAGAACDADIARIVYLGGLARGDGLSPHMRSRHEVGRILRESGVPALELRASVVIGDGSLSYELVRRAVESSSALVLPDWVETRCQPIALDDVVAYLRAAHDVPLERSELVEIGGADVTTYRGLLDAYARVRGLATVVATVPVPSLPVPGRLLPRALRAPAKLVESLRFDSTVESRRARELFPAIRPIGLDAAIEAAGV